MQKAISYNTCCKTRNLCLSNDAETVIGIKYIFYKLMSAISKIIIVNTNVLA